MFSVWGRSKRDMEGRDVAKTGGLPIGKLENIRSAIASDGDGDDDGEMPVALGTCDGLARLTSSSEKELCGKMAIRRALKPGTMP